MPIYEYHCNNCGSSFERLRKMSEADDPIECKHCGSKATVREVSKCFSPNASVLSRSGCGSCSGGSCSSCHS